MIQRPRVTDNKNRTIVNLHPATTEQYMLSSQDGYKDHKPMK